MGNTDYDAVVSWATVMRSPYFKRGRDHYRLGMNYPPNYDSWDQDNQENYEAGRQYAAGFIHGRGEGNLDALADQWPDLIPE